MQLTTLDTSAATIEQVPSHIYGGTFHVKIGDYLLGAYFTRKDAEARLAKLHEQKTITIY